MNIANDKRHNWFKINDRAYKVSVLSLNESFQILYSSNTGRTIEEGAPMLLDPIGTFFTYKIEIGYDISAGDDMREEFEALYELAATPSYEGVIVQIPRGSGKAWETKDSNGNIIDGFEAYISSGERAIKHIELDSDGNADAITYESFTLTITPMRAQILPE